MSKSPRLTFLAIDTEDLESSIEFYRLILGDFLHDSSHDADKEDDWYGGTHVACSWTDGSFFHFAIYPAKSPNRPVTRGAQIGFHVENFDDVNNRLQTAAVKTIQEPREEPWGRTARYLDPDNNIVSITQAVT